MNHPKIQACIVTGLGAFALLVSAALILFAFPPPIPPFVLGTGMLFSVMGGYTFRQFVVALRSE